MTLAQIALLGPWLEVPVYGIELEGILRALLPKGQKHPITGLRDFIDYFYRETPIYNRLCNANRVRNDIVHALHKTTEVDWKEAALTFATELRNLTEVFSPELRHSLIAEELTDLRAVAEPHPSIEITSASVLTGQVPASSQCPDCNAPIVFSSDQKADLMYQPFLLCPNCGGAVSVSDLVEPRLKSAKMLPWTYYVHCLPPGSTPSEVSLAMRTAGWDILTVFIPTDSQGRFHTSALVQGRPDRWSEPVELDRHYLDVEKYNGQLFDAEKAVLINKRLKDVPLETRGIVSRDLECYCTDRRAPKCTRCGECYCMDSTSFDHTDLICGTCNEVAAVARDVEEEREVEEDNSASGSFADRLNSLRWFD